MVAAEVEPFEDSSGEPISVVDFHAARRSPFTMPAFQKSASLRGAVKSMETTAAGCVSGSRRGGGTMINECPGAVGTCAKRCSSVATSEDRADTAPRPPLCWCPTSR